MNVVHKHVQAIRLGFNTTFLADQWKSCHFGLSVYIGHGPENRGSDPSRL